MTKNVELTTKSATLDIESSQRLKLASDTAQKAINMVEQANRVAAEKSPTGKYVENPMSIKELSDLQLLPAASTVFPEILLFLIRFLKILS